MKRQLFTVILVALAIFTQFNLSSCKKSNDDPSSADEQEALLMDSTYYFSLVYSLWNESLPMPRVISNTELDLRRFTRNYSNAEQVLDALIDYMPKNGRGDPLDRFSFIDRQRQVSEEIEQGLHRDIGVSHQFLLLSPSSNQVGLFIRLVQKNSPAEQAGLERGQQIIAVDGSQISFTANSNGQVQGDIGAFNRIMRGDVQSLGVYDFDEEQERTVAIPATGSYIIDPIVEKKVLELDNGTKVGYIAYDSFVSVRHSGSGATNTYYNQMVDAFSGLGDIDELVVDLRYNGGGAGNAAELMTNLIAPNEADGKVMYDYVVNEILQAIPNNPFSPEYINKTGLPSLNLSKVYFLVTNRSASASEMVINSLKPHMDVQIISSGEGTYGKPVGSFRTRVLGGYADLYITSFKTVNADGGGDYFDGLVANKRGVRDNLDKQLGDPQENLLAEALYHIANGGYRTGTGSSSRATAGTGKQDQIFWGEELNAPALERSVQGLFIFDKIDMN